MITEPEQADAIVVQGQADTVMVGRTMLRLPYWALHAAAVGGGTMRTGPHSTSGREIERSPWGAS